MICLLNLHSYNPGSATVLLVLIISESFCYKQIISGLSGYCVLLSVINSHGIKEYSVLSGGNGYFAITEFL